MPYSKKLLPLAQTGLYPALLTDYLHGKLSGKGIYSHEPNLEGLAGAMAARVAKPAMVSRSELVQVFRNQYQGRQLTAAQEANLQLLLKPNTFTVTTGHQINLMTGPLYVPLKLVTAVLLCQRLKERYPTHDFVPVYWMATEDHDKDEVDHFNLFGKRLKWETDQQGPVGRFTWPPAQEFWEQLPADFDAATVAAYNDATTWADATRSLVQHWLGESGLLALDPDDAVLKKAFVNIALADAIDHAHQPLHHLASQSLEQQGYRTQVNAREINLFYIGPEAGGKAIRERLVKTETGYEVLNSGLTFSADSLAEAIRNEPTQWSANVVLRPLYQEAILPNIAYLGGPAEVAYWLQTKPLFDLHNIPMPVVLPRIMAQISQKSIVQRQRKLGLSFQDLLLEPNQLKALVVARQQGSNVDISVEHKLLSQAFSMLRDKAQAADPTLAAFADAQQASVLKIVDAVEKRISKAWERKHETAITQAFTLREKLLPGDAPQERHENICSYLANDPALWQTLLSELDPLSFAYHLLEEEV